MDGNNRLQLNSGNTDSGFWDWLALLSSLVLNENAPDRPRVQSGVLLDSQLLPNGQVARRVFAQLCLMHQLCLLLDWRPYLQSLILQSPRNWTTAMCSTLDCPWRLFRRFSWYRIPWHVQLNALLKQHMLYLCSVRCISCLLLSWPNSRWTAIQI